MTNTRNRTLALLLVAGLLVAALVGVAALHLSDDGSGAGEAGGARVLSRPPSDGSSAPVIPSGEAARAPSLAPAPVVQPLSAPVQRLGPDQIVVRVVDEETGAPVTAFTVDILPFAAEPPLLRLKTAETRPIPVKGASGVFRAECKRGRYDIVVRAAGYLPGVLPDLVVPALDGTPVPLQLSHGPSITGIVYDEVRRPVVNVPVFLGVTRLFVDATPPKLGVVMTGSDGRFRFSPLPSGDYSLALLEPDNLHDRLPSVIVNQGTTEVSLYLAPRHQVVISVQDRRGRPVRDADVELRNAAKLVSARTLESGQAVLRFLPDGDYALKVQRDGYEPLSDAIVLQGGQGELVRWYTLLDADGG